MTRSACVKNEAIGLKNIMVPLSPEPPIAKPRVAATLLDAIHFKCPIMVEALAVPNHHVLGETFHSMAARLRKRIFARSGGEVFQNRNRRI